jgi:hypothetical protein
METINENCYVYKWTHIPTLKWYVGVRFAKGCYPDDGYICSSKIVKPLIETNPNEWKREIISTGTKEAMTELESEILEFSDAAKNPRSFNQHNNIGKFYNSGIVSEETCKKISDAKKKNPRCGFKQSEEAKKKIAKASKNRTHSEETRKKMSEAKKGKSGIPRTEETRKKISKSNSNPSEETRKKISDASKNRTHSEETKKKLREIRKHQVFSEEARKKMSETRKAKLASGEIVLWNKGKNS